MDNWLENQVTCTEWLCWLVLILVNQPLGLMKADQCVSLHMHVRVTPCRPSGASERCARFAQHNLPVAFQSHLIHSLTNEKKNSYHSYKY